MGPFLKKVVIDIRRSWRAVSVGGTKYLEGVALYYETDADEGVKFYPNSDDIESFQYSWSLRLARAG